MKIKSNLPFNTHLSAKHNGNGHPERLAIPSGSTITLSDDEWKKFAKPAEGLIESGSLELVEAPALTEEEQVAADEAAVIKAEAVLAKLKPTDKKGLSKPIKKES